jgi:hypothetical protein
MSRDVKYIGMDVHKEAVVIAVLNSSGKLQQRDSPGCHGTLKPATNPAAVSVV